MAEKYLPNSLCILSLAENRIASLAQFTNLTQCRCLLQLSIQGNLFPENNSHHTRAYVLAVIPSLKFIDGCQLSDEERQFAEHISKFGDIQRFAVGNEEDLLQFLQDQDAELHEAPQFYRQIDVRATYKKRGLSNAVANEVGPTQQHSSPPRWLQRARSAHNITTTTSLNASASGFSDSINTLKIRPRMEAPCNGPVTSGPRLLRSESVFIPIDDEDEGYSGFDNQVEKHFRNSPPFPAQTVSVDVCNEPTPMTHDRLPVPTRTRPVRYSEGFLRSLTATSRFIPSSFSVTAEETCLNGTQQENEDYSKQDEDVEAEEKEVEEKEEEAPAGRRLKFSRSAFATLLRRRKSASSFTDNSKSPVIGVVSDTNDPKSDGGVSEYSSGPSENTFVADPPEEPRRLSGGLEAEIVDLRRQLEEFRTTSAKQEHERRQQAEEIRKLTEEVRNLKAWKASMLRKTTQKSASKSAAGDCKRHTFEEAHVLPEIDPNSLSTLSSLVALNKSPSTSVKRLHVALTEPLSADESMEALLEEDMGEIPVEPEDSLLPPVSSSLENGSLLTANISTDSLETRNSRPTPTPMGFEHQFAAQSAENEEEYLLASESTLLGEHDVATSVG